MAEEIFNLRQKEFVYKKTASGRLVTHFSNLVDYQQGAAVANFRRGMEERAHLPISLWK